jgi:hypothetical protein
MPPAIPWRELPACLRVLRVAGLLAWFGLVVSILTLGAIENAALTQPNRPAGIFLHQQQVKGAIRYVTDEQQLVYLAGSVSMMASWAAAFILGGISSNLEERLRKQRRQAVLASSPAIGTSARSHRSSDPAARTACSYQPRPERVRGAVRDCREVREDEASPRKTASDRLRRRMSSSERRPTRTPTFDFGTVVILSTIIRHVRRNPLRGLGSTASRNNGAPFRPS